MLKNHYVISSFWAMTEEDKGKINETRGMGVQEEKTWEGEKHQMGEALS